MTLHTVHIEGYDAPKDNLVEQSHLPEPEMPETEIARWRQIKFVGEEAHRVLSHACKAGWKLCDEGHGSVNLTMGSAEDAARELASEAEAYLVGADEKAGKDSSHLEVVAELKYLRWRVDVALRKAWASELGSINPRNEISRILKDAAEKVERRY